MRARRYLSWCLKEYLMRVGIKSYVKPTDFPDTVPVFPLSSALLLPGGQMPLNIFEPRYMSMVDEALAGNRLIGMVQPSFTARNELRERPELCAVGCLGRGDERRGQARGDESRRCQQRQQSPVALRCRVCAHANSPEFQQGADGRPVGRFDIVLR